MFFVLTSTSDQAPQVVLHSYIGSSFLQVGMNSSLSQFKEKERLDRKVSKSNRVVYICASFVIAQAELNDGCNLRGGWSSMSNHMPAVKQGGGELRVLEESSQCPHCPKHCEPSLT